MFNLYSYQKRKEENLKEENKSGKKFIYPKIKMKKNEKLIKNYENRLKVYLSENMSELNKLFRKTNTFMPKFKSGDNSPKNNRIFSKTNKIFKINTKNCKSEEKNNYLNPQDIYEHIILSTSNIENNIIYQPRLRFSPRNDLERIFYEMKDKSLLSGNIKYYKGLSNKIIKLRNKEISKERKINFIKSLFNKFFLSKDNAKINLYKLITDIKKNKKNYTEKEKGNGLDISNIGQIKKYFMGHINKYIIEDNDDSITRIDGAQNDINNNLNNGYIDYVDIKEKEKQDLIKKERNKLINQKIKNIIRAKRSLHKTYDNKRYINSFKDSTMIQKLAKKNSILPYEEYESDRKNKGFKSKNIKKNFSETFYNSNLSYDKKILNGKVKLKYE